MSVRNLVEIVCIPPIMAGFYYCIKEKKLGYLLAGLWFGVSFIFRYQSMILPGGVGLVLLFSKNFKNIIYLLIGFLLPVVLIQGTIDWLAWGYPFASFWSYLTFNATHGESYTTGPFYRYLLLIIGILIPPTSFLLLYGFCRTWKKQIIIFFPVLLFFLFHSIYPNKQERFIFPIFPLIVMLSIIGCESLADISKFWQKHKATLKGLWFWFWAVNTMLLLVLTFTYSKKTRVEPLTYLSHKQSISGIFVERGKLGDFMLPLFYLNKNVPVYDLLGDYNSTDIERNIYKKRQKFPNYAVFYGKEDIEKRIGTFENAFGVRLFPETVISPSLIDDILYKLNPRHNKNQTALIFKINY